MSARHTLFAMAAIAVAALVSRIASIRSLPEISRTETEFLLSPAYHGIRALKELVRRTKSSSF